MGGAILISSTKTALAFTGEGRVRADAIAQAHRFLSPAHTLTPTLSRSRGNRRFPLPREAKQGFAESKREREKFRRERVNLKSAEAF